MTLDQIAEARGRIETRMDELSKELRALPRSSMGLIPDSVRATPQYTQPKAEFDRLFQQLRRINSSLTAQQKRALSARHRAAA